MVEYFDELFSASDTSNDNVLDCVKNCISNEQNDYLMSRVEKCEVKRALFSMHPHKSPGPDGMSQGFYQKFWHIVGDDVYEFVNIFFISRKFEGSITDTNIVLIPKKSNPVRMTELRPISLCNVL